MLKRELDMRVQDLSKHLERSSTVQFNVLISTIYHLDVNERKVLLKYCRIRGTVPMPKKSGWRMMLPMDTIITIFEYSESQKRFRPVQSSDLYDFVVANHLFFQSSISAGFTSMILRYLPYEDEESCRKTEAAVLEKEITAIQSEGFQPGLDYSAVLRRRFSKDKEESMVPGLQNREKVEADISFRIESSMKDLIRRQPILIPKTSMKTFCTKGYNGKYRPYERYNGGQRIRTLADVERVYCRSGMMLHGPVELRQAWKPNDLKPRTYYARGPSVHFYSSLIQHLFNCLVDALPTTHRKERFLTSDLQFSENDVLMIYDYSSFTSNLEEIKRFTSYLSLYFEGFTIRVLDSFEGVKEVDVGILLREFNDHCNHNVDVDVSEILDITDTVFSISRGLLGIPGNISSSTLLHGIHLAVIAGALHRSKCVGDDAMAAFWGETLEEKEELIEAIGQLGELAKEKVAQWEYSGDEDSLEWEYCKRPITRIENRVVQGTLVTLPGLDVVASMFCSHHIRRRRIDLSCEVFRRKVFISQLIALMDACPSLDGTDLEILRAYLLVGYRSNDLKPNGHYDSRIQRLYPCLDDFGSLTTWRESILANQHLSFNCCVELPLYLEPREERSRLCQSELIQSDKSIWPFLEKMGFVSREDKRGIFVVQDLIDNDTIDDRLLLIFPRIKAFRVVEPLPAWIVSWYPTEDLVE